MVETVTEEKVPLEAKNKPFLVCGFLGAFWNLSYGSEDHLGSTRMVLDEDGTVKEALMYQPYGTVSDIQGITTPGNDPLRQKFTNKELELDNKSSEILVHVVVTNVPEVFEPAVDCKPYLQLNFSDGSREILDVLLSDYGTLSVSKKSAFGNEKTIISIELHAEGVTTEKSIHYTVNSLYQTIGAGQILLIDMMEVVASQLMIANPPNHYNFFVADDPDLKNDGYYYFGARFYNPDLGLWMSQDKLEQFFSPYAYTGNAFNPVNAKDVGGLWVEDLTFGLGYAVKFRVGVDEISNQYIFGLGFGYGLGVKVSYDKSYAAVKIDNQYAAGKIWGHMEGSIKTGNIFSPEIGLHLESMVSNDCSEGMVTVGAYGQGGIGPLGYGVLGGEQAIFYSPSESKYKTLGNAYDPQGASLARGGVGVFFTVGAEIYWKKSGNKPSKTAEALEMMGYNMGPMGSHYVPSYDFSTGTVIYQTSAIDNIRVDLNFDFANYTIPEITAPQINIPLITIPEITIPTFNFNFNY